MEGDMIDEQAERIVAAWPELTNEQLDNIAALLRGVNAEAVA
jgi:hypothetical protein